MADEKLIFPIGFDLEDGVKQAKKEWKNTYQKQLQEAIDAKPIKLKMEFETRGFNPKELKEWIALSREAEKVERDRIKNESARQKIADRQAMEATKRAIKVEESNAKIERANKRAEISEQRKSRAVRNANEAYKTQSSYIVRLGERLAAYASIMQTFSFLRNIREVTAEFELQRVALGSIIGDLNEANKMFEQIKAAAVKSPFQIKELVSYTKQLAAYKIGTNELFDTTQKLADISAGLGVSMERLVLAYGQIRATGYLRASEVRQLTEAGVPIIEELAKKMSELRGETVSAAEVMGMISERAISFGMVKDVFDDLISAGGMFYKMQEKQAETLAGQISNLKDSFSIMYEEMGNTESVSNKMKSVIALIKSLAENWRTVGAIIESVAISMTGYLVSMKNLSVVSQMLGKSEAIRLAIESKQMIIIPKWLSLFDKKNRLYRVAIALEKAYKVAVIKSAMATNILSKSFWSLSKVILANPFTALAAVLAGLTIAMIKFATKTKTVQEHIEGLNNAMSSFTNLKGKTRKLIDEFDVLSQKTNKSAQEQKRLNDITKELASKYPSATNEIKEYGKEIGITANKVKDLYEAEMKLRRDKLKSELADSEKEYSKLERQFQDINAKIKKGTYTKAVINAAGDVSFYEQAYSDKELEELAAKALEIADKMRPLAETINDAKVALGELPSKSNAAIDAFGSWKKTIRDFQTGFKNLKGEDVPLFNADIVNNFANLNDALDKTAEEYKKNDEAIKRYSNTLLSGKLTKAEKEDISRKVEMAIAFKKTALAILDYYNARYLLEDKNKKSELAILQEELQLHEKIYAKYKEYRKYMSEEQAKAKVEEYFGDTIKSLKYTPSFEKSGYQNVLTQYQDAIKALLAKAKNETEKGAIKKVLLELGFKIDDVNWQAEKENLEDKVKDLSYKLSRTKAAQGFFDRMLGLTGDKQLSATLTMSVYGMEADKFGDEMFANLKEQAETVFKGVDISSAFDEEAKKIDYSKLTPFIEQLPENLQKNARAFVDAGVDANAKWLEDLQKTYQKAFTFEERRTQVAKEEKQKRDEIEASKLGIDEKKRYTEASKKREAERISAINLEEFKESSDYLRIFEDIENLSIPIIDELIRKIKNLIATNKELNATDLKNLTEQIQKLEEGKARKSAWFAGLGEGIKEWFKAVDAMTKAKKGTEEYKQAVIDANKAHAKVVNSLGNLQNEFSQAQQLVDDFAGAIGVAEDSGFGAFLDGMSNALGGVAKSLAFAQLAVQLFDGTIKSFLASNPIGWILLIVSAIISAVQAIMNAKVKAIDKEIERLQGTLDNLEYAYERLEKAAEKAFGTDYIANYEQRVANLQAQLEAYQKQLTAEQSKGKKADDDKIKEYQEAIRDTADAMKDMQSELSEHFLGTDLTSAARDFANAWIEAYKEFGSTTDAMKEKFQDMIENMIVESFAARVIQSALEPIFQDIDKMMKDGTLDISDAARIAELTDVAVGNINVGMNNLMNALAQAGISVRGMGSELTGISRDIATASEESILGLAAGINTQNFYISQVPAKMDIIIGLLQGGKLEQGSAITLQDLVTLQNQHLSYLPTIAQHTAETVAECKMIVAETRRTADALERVIKPNGTQSTYKLNATLSQS